VVGVKSDDRRVDSVDGVLSTQARSCLVVVRAVRIAQWVGDGRGNGNTTAVCVAFESDSPLEYPCEDEPEEPVPFDLDAVDRRLAALDGDL